MKRIGNIYHKIISIKNLELADKKARKGKKNKKEIIEFDKNRKQNIENIHLMLRTKTYKTSAYIDFTVNDTKPRLVSMLPYRDRLIHHAVFNVLEPIFIRSFTANTYSSIKGRGVHKCLYKLRNVIADNENLYALKIDIQKFYPSVDNTILKKLLRKKFKDSNLLWLLDEIIDSKSGLPLGNYSSQILANFYLAYFDHWLKETKRAKYVFRYCDDVLILSENKDYLQNLLKEIISYLSNNLKLTVKPNHRIFPVNLGIDFLGYVSYPTHTLLRKRIKRRFLKMMKYRRNERSIASYNGWLKHCNSKNLIKSINNIN